MEATPHKNLFERNRTKLTVELEQQELTVIFAGQRMPRNGDQYFPFRQDSDFFYLTGIEQPESILVLNQSDAFLFITEPSGQVALWEGQQLDAEKARGISGVENIRWLGEFGKVMERLLQTHHTVCFNLPEKIAPGKPQSRDAVYLEEFTKTRPFHRIRSLRPRIKKLRLKKEPEELEYIRQAIDITHQAFSRVLQTLQPGIKEKTLEAEITHQLIISGAQGFAFDPILASGNNATTLHYTANSGICQNEDLLLMDFGAEYRNYAADITRTLPVSGNYTPRQKECYQAVLEVMNELMGEIKPGTTIAQLQQQVARALSQKHQQLGLYSASGVKKEENLWKKYFPHGVSHFMGLDVHDYGDKNTMLEKGMVISWEPGLYIPEEGIGIRIEDDILVDDTPVNLSAGIPKDPGQIESLMQEKATT